MKDLFEMIKAGTGKIMSVAMISLSFKVLEYNSLIVVVKHRKIYPIIITGNPSFFYPGTTITQIYNLVA